MRVELLRGLFQSPVPLAVFVSVLGEGNSYLDCEYQRIFCGIGLGLSSISCLHLSVDGHGTNHDWKVGRVELLMEPLQNPAPLAVFVSGFSRVQGTL